MKLAFNCCCRHSYVTSDCRSFHAKARRFHGDARQRRLHGDPCLWRFHGDPCLRRFQGDASLRRFHGDPCLKRFHGDARLRRFHGDASIVRGIVFCFFFVEQQMEVAIIDLFVCGSEPTSAALAWAILCMIAFPDIQEKCHEEIDCVSGGDRSGGGCGGSGCGGFGCGGGFGGKLVRLRS